MTFRKARPTRQTRSNWLVLALVSALVVSATGAFTFRDHLWGARADARAAIEALKEGDLVALDHRLAANRGRQDFAYFFASKATPRDLGDALATVAGTSDDEPFKAGVDTQAYELLLADLAGALALATHGRGDRTLPKSWTADFITATTNPVALYGKHDGFLDKDGKRREKQDQANRSNLLLLLSRGYWSSEFLQSVTKSFYDFDRREGDDAWPDADPGDDVRYAPAPSGVYVTDGVLALTAALTANPAASEWAFTDFQPGLRKIDADYSIGKFTHYLMFEHEFPESDGESIGMTATLTALSSAIDSARSRAAGTEAERSAKDTADLGPMQDVVILQAIAHALAESDCSWNPLDYGHCVIDAAKAVWRWVKRWGHSVLDILTVATSFAPPPFNVISLAPGTLNATWYAIESDYARAGLSVAAAVPGLAFVKIAKGAAAKDATNAVNAAAKSDEVAKVSRFWRPQKPWKDCDLSAAGGGIRVQYGSAWTRAQRRAADEKLKAISDAAARGELKKTLVLRSGTASSTYRKATGRDVPAGHDVDHTIELQLGGSDHVTNLKPLDTVVNRSIGRQIALQLKNLEYGAPIPSAAIC